MLSQYEYNVPNGKNNIMVSQKEIDAFLHGNDNEEHIVSLEYNYSDDKIYKIVHDPIQGKQIKIDNFIPFAWVADLHSTKFYGGYRDALKKAMKYHGIVIENLNTENNHRLESGLKYIVKSTKTYNNLVSFFKSGGLDPWSRDPDLKDKILILSPVEQYLIQKEKRLFKGIEEYEDIHRLVFDIETTGLDPKENSIFLIGIKDNRGYEKVLAARNEDEEIELIEEFFDVIIRLKPAIVGGYNSAFFDIPFILKRAEILGLDIEEISRTLHPDHTLRQRESILKLGNEIEKFEQTYMFGFNIIDISHSVRRAQAINSDIKRWSLKYITKFVEANKPNRVYIDGDKLGEMYFGDEEYYFNPKSGGYRKVGSSGTENLLEKYPNSYEVVKGSYLVERYLYDDIWETMVVDEEFNQANFLLSKLVPTTYQRLSTMGTATLWKMIMLAWSYKHGLAIPAKAENRPFVGGLSRLIKTGYSTNVLKLDFSSLYPSIQLVHDVFPDCDVSGAIKSMLKYFRDTRIKFKKLAEKYRDSDKKLSSKYSRKQLPIKIFINSCFGALSAPNVFHWGDVDMGEQITCTGRQYLRQMVMFFMDRGYMPLVMDTDGVNFSVPKDRGDYTYIGKGNNELVEKGKQYTGSNADVAEYNDLFMKGEMGLDTDGQWPSTINVARKNYALLTDKGKVKLTGNTIKSKKIPTYIEEFLDKGLTLLLHGKGSKFLDYYYDYAKKIYDKKIPLAKIANKSRVKQSVEDYKVHITKRTKAGTLMARQAHMELVIKNNISVGLGDTIYYINNGSRKSHGDVKKINHWRASAEERKLYHINNGKRMPPDEVEITLNCYLLDEKEISENPDKLGDYNAPKYLDMFNKRIKPLLVVFSPEIRDDILIDDPENRPIFTKHQTELINGHPVRKKDQDDLVKDVLLLSGEEVNFWKVVNIDPFYMYPSDEDKKSLVKDYLDMNYRLFLN